jgi:hypothetical protein
MHPTPLHALRWELRSVWLNPRVCRAIEFPHPTPRPTEAAASGEARPDASGARWLEVYLGWR